MDRHFGKEDTWMPNKHKKRCSKYLVTKETQIKPQWDAPTHTLACLKLKTDDVKCWQG